MNNNIGVLTMDKVPTIQSIDDPPELHAKRIVSAMLKWMVPRHDALIHETAKLFASKSHNGNPKSQYKSMERLKQMETTIAVCLNPGKRGSYSFTCYNWGVWDLERDFEAVLSSKDSEQLWLVAWRDEYVFKKGRMVTAVNMPRLFYTFHFLVRLAMRCGARTPQDLVEAAVEIFAAFLEHVGPGCDASKAAPLPCVPLVSGGYAVLEPYQPLFGGKERPQALVVTTVLT